jgi:hypothetical protein
MWSSKPIVLTLLLFQIILFCNCELLFVNEVCRHGARAPETDTQPEGFPNGKGMLTSSGIRQHYLLGRQLRKRYRYAYKNIKLSAKNVE